MAFVAIAMMSCSASRTDQMSENIAYCEQTLDSLSKHTSFDDTVGETDEYMFLCEAKQAFDNAKTDSEKRQAYKWYNYWYDKCIKMSIDTELCYRCYE